MLKLGNHSFVEITTEFNTLSQYNGRRFCKVLVAESHTQKKLLHGDFHHDNILLGQNGEYTIIDPKGVIGDPVCDIPRFILNEFDDEKTVELFKKINDIISILEQKLGIPNHILRQCLYVETTMGVCWCVEDGSAPEEYPKLLEEVAFAEAILNA